MSSPDRPPVGAHGDRPALAELFGSPLGMALGAEAADVAVLVRSATGQRHDVVRYGRLADNPGSSAITAEGLDTEPTQALGDCTASAQSFSHVSSRGQMGA